MTEPAKTPRRYIVIRCEGGADTMHPSVDGDWCPYNDVAPLLQRIAELELKLNSFCICPTWRSELMIDARCPIHAKK